MGIKIDLVAELSTANLVDAVDAVGALMDTHAVEGCYIKYNIPFWGSFKLGAFEASVIERISKDWMDEITRYIKEGHIQIIAP